MQVLKNSSKLVMGIGAVLIIIGFMIMGQFVHSTSLNRRTEPLTKSWTLILINQSSTFLSAGPCKWLPFEKSVTSIICGMILHGCGLGASLVGGFSDAHKSAVSSLLVCFMCFCCAQKPVVSCLMYVKLSRYLLGCPTPLTPMELYPACGPRSLHLEHL